MRLQLYAAAGYRTDGTASRPLLDIGFEEILAQREEKRCVVSSCRQERRRIEQLLPSEVQAVDFIDIDNRLIVIVSAKDHQMPIEWPRTAVPTTPPDACRLISTIDDGFLIQMSFPNVGQIDPERPCLRVQRGFEEGDVALASLTIQSREFANSKKSTGQNQLTDF
ncbi:hypothetical protein D3C77_329050 [compost metagenome]